MIIYFVIMGKFTKFELLIAKNQSIVINIANHPGNLSLSVMA